MLRLRALTSIVLIAVCGCGGNGASSTSTANGSSIVVTVTPAKADADAGGSVVLQSNVVGDTKYSGLNINLSGAGSVSTIGPDFFGTYSTTYTAPGSPTALNSTSLVGTSATITVASKTDSPRNVVVPISLHDNIQFPSQAPPAALAGKPYTYTFAASGGTGTLTFTLLSTSTPLPAGLTLSSSGVLSGTPTAVGTYTFQVLVADQATKVVGIARPITVQVS